MEVPFISPHLINDHTICDMRLVTINSVSDGQSRIRGRLGIITLILQQRTRHMTTGGSVCKPSSSNPSRDFGPLVFNQTFFLFLFFGNVQVTLGPQTSKVVCRLIPG